MTTRGLQQLKSNQDEIFTNLVQNIKSMTGIGKEMGICPECQGTLVFHTGKDNSRFLRCSNPLCETILPLPKKGVITTIENEICHICKGIPLLVSSKFNNWIMCPICWTEKAKDEKPWFCSDCNRKECPFSGNWEPSLLKQSFGTCPECQGEVLLTFDNTNTQVVCSNCKNRWNAPNLRKGTTITLGDPCSNCGQQTLSVYKRRKKPYRLCVFCNLFFF